MRLLALLAVAAAATAAAADPSLILPGKQIGPARVGMTREQIAAAVRPHHCQVNALFRDGLAVQLMTSWGGACATPGGAQVGFPLAWAVREFGPPPATAPGRTYTWPSGRSARAVWALYEGIAFRAVVPEGEPEVNGVITCISVHTDPKPALPESCTAEGGDPR
jgi:hypothetical protein